MSAHMPFTKSVSGMCLGTSLLMMWMLGWGSLAQAQHMGGPGAIPGRPGGIDRPGGQGRGWSPPGFVRAPDRDMSEGLRSDAPPRFQRVVSLDDAVSMVQTRFKATAVKTETITDEGQLVYRIRLLSADRSRVWTVSVDARSGQVN